MRTRKEILADGFGVDEQARILEVLLDIRDLLSPDNNK